MNMNNDDFKVALERLELLTDEMRRIKCAIIAVQNGTPFTEAWNEEVFLEAKQDQKKSMSYLYRIVEHLLKIKYCTNDFNYDHWRGEINTFRSKAFDITGWKSRKNRDTNLINYLINNLDDIYEVGASYYVDDVRKYSDLREGLELIPEECPWTLEELMDMDIDELLEKMDITDEEEIDNE